ncbi:MAG: S-layer homology domain-containing protein, partial [Oscillospiraceae bacterium]
ERVDTKDATCTEEGYTGDVVCSVCGEVIEKGEVISALGHKTEIVGAKDATCTEAGYTGDEVCTVCGEVIEKGEVISALGHKTEIVGAKDATCTEDGYTGDVVCSVCGEVIEKGEVISALGHKTEIVGAKDATCTEAGYTGDEVCSVCGEVIEKGEVIAALGHTPADERVDAKAATCTEAGYTGDEVCTVCGEVIEKGEAIAALGHDYKDGVCTVCGAEDPDYKPAEYPFTDVDVDGKHAPFADAILWAANEGITTGYGDGIFKPDANCTRAQVVTFLWRAAGSPTPKSTDNPFVDVAAKQANGKDNPYYTAILWAVSEGITLGVDSTHFAPDATVTRAQFVTFLWRYEGKPEAKPGVTLTDLGTVTNADFKSAILWAAGEGITTGYADGSFRPNAVCTRAHVVTFIYRDMT